MHNATYLQKNLPITEYTGSFLFSEYTWAHIGGCGFPCDRSEIRLKIKAAAGNSFAVSITAHSTPPLSQTQYIQRLPLSPSWRSFHQKKTGYLFSAEQRALRPRLVDSQTSTRMTTISSGNRSTAITRQTTCLSVFRPIVVSSVAMKCLST